jgi:hypothetical protein
MNQSETRHYLNSTRLDLGIYANWYWWFTIWTYTYKRKKKTSPSYNEEFTSDVHNDHQLHFGIFHDAALPPDEFVYIIQLNLKIFMIKKMTFELILNQLEEFILAVFLMRILCRVRGVHSVFRSNFSRTLEFSTKCTQCARSSKQKNIEWVSYLQFQLCSFQGSINRARWNRLCPINILGEKMKKKT